MNGLPQTEGRPLRLRQLASVDPESVEGCHVAYIGAVSAEERSRLRAVDHPLLTIRERDPMCRDGSMFCLKTEPSRVSFDLNLDAVSRSGLRVDPKVLLLGRRAGRP